MTLLTVIFVLGPMYEDGNGWYIMLCTSSMLYHHLLNPLAAILSFTLLERTPRLPRSTVKWALLPTAVYGAVLLWCIAILGMDYLYAWLLWKENGGKKKQ